MPCLFIQAAAHKVKKMLSALEIRRKAFHLFLGVFIALFFYFGFINWLFMLALVAIGFIVSHFAKTKNLPIIDFLLEKFDRPQDIKKFPGKGALMLLLGILLAMLLFEKNIAIASIMILALGDSIAALLGPFGSIVHPLNKLKLVEGAIAGTVSGFVGAAVFVKPWIAFWGSFVAMGLEALDIEFFQTRIDDNLMIPVVAGIVMTFLASLA